MPNLKTHCAISKKRTNFKFEDLHKWIDKPTKKLGINHRRERHYYNEEDENTIKAYWDKEKGKGWGDKAIVEWLFHIAIDNLETAFKFSLKKGSYGDRTYNYMEFVLYRNHYIDCNFKRISDDKLSN